MTADGPPARDAVSARLASTAPELGPAFLSAYESAGREPARRRFGGVSQRLHELAAEAASHGPHTATLANRWLLARLAETFDATAAPLPLPPEVLAGYPAHIARILRQAEELPDEAFDVSRDSFQKDLGLLTFRLIPVGVFFGDPKAPVSRRYARRGGVRQLVRYLRVIRLECHGRDPFLSLHLNEAALEGWGEAAFVPSHLAAAAVLGAAMPRLKGVTGGGWIIDPQLDRIAPHLAWVRKADGRRRRQRLLPAPRPGRDVGRAHPLGDAPAAVRRRAVRAPALAARVASPRAASLGGETTLPSGT